MTADISSYKDPGKLAAAIVKKIGKKIVLALPLGLGKACHIANALVDLALRDSTIELKILTALTLEFPRADSDLARRFLEPARSRLFGEYPVLTYATLLRNRQLPDNITVNEFFFLAGSWLSVPAAQQNYIPANYTHVLPLLLAQGVNVIAQLITRHDDAYSLSCNPDITPDLLKARQVGKCEFVFAGQINSELPFMYGDAELPAEEIDFLLDGPDTDFELYSVPKRPVSLPAQAVGLRVASLVQDGGTLQIGIGSISDAVTRALILRHTDHRQFQSLCKNLSGEAPRYDTAFEEGLYGVSEMFVDGFLQLASAGILKREIDGVVLHGGFFVDCRDFYKKLHAMSEAERARFQMKPVSFTNEIYGDEENKRQARKKACFVNSAMKVTLLGAVISDALEDGAVVSGVGGQYNFVSQAFALDGARSIMTVDATRTHKGKTISNIVWSYGHETIPWHLRDIIVTEYGIADVRGKSDAETIAALICIADSRFQEDLLQNAQVAGKIGRAWKIPEKHESNTPDHITQALLPARNDGILPEFPFGTDFTPTEQRLLPALDHLKNNSHSKRALLNLFVTGLKGIKEPVECDALDRMKLKDPSSLKEFILQKLLMGALHRTSSS